MFGNLAMRLALPMNANVQIARPRPISGRRPSVSVIIPCYNYGRYLTQCVSSVLGQQDVNVEVLIIDDASADGSDQVVRGLGARDPRIRTVCHAENKGHIATYNEGIALVTGDYTVLLSADDMLTPGCLARAASLMEHHPSVGLAYGHPLDFTDGHVPAPRTAARSWIIWPGHSWLRERCRAGANIIRSPEVVIRTSILRGSGGYRAHLPHAADFELWLRTAAVSDIGYVAGADQAYYRNHASNMHHSSFDMLDDLSQRLASFDTVFAANEGRLADHESLRDLAHRALARNALRQAIRDTAHHALARNPLSAALREYSRDAVGGEEISGYAALALRAWPDARNLREWRTLARLGHDSAAPRLSPSLAARMARRKFQTRLGLLRRRLAGI